MRIRRGLLFGGLFLIPLGAIPLLVRGGYLDADLLTNAWQLWPLILIGLGLALLLGRSQAGLIGTVVVALVLGGMAGAALASGPTWFGSITDCAPVSADSAEADHTGTFSGAASVTVELDCGSFDLVTQPGSAWQAHGAYRGPEPRVTATGTSLVLRGPAGSGSHRQEWDVTVGTDAMRTLELQLNAAAADVDLAGAAMSSIRADLNAGSLVLGAGDATVEAIDLSVNAGSIQVALGSGSTSGEIDANAGSIELCVPPEAELRFDVDEELTFSTNLQSRGLTHSGDAWTRSGTSGDVISLDIEGNVASLTLDPEGGCD